MKLQACGIFTARAVSRARREVGAPREIVLSEKPDFDEEAQQIPPNTTEIVEECLCSLIIYENIKKVK